MGPSAGGRWGTEVYRVVGRDTKGALEKLIASAGIHRVGLRTLRWMFVGREDLSEVQE